jgi:hypothetical protein
MIAFAPHQRPTLDQIRTCSLCAHASHRLAIQTLVEDQIVWNRRHPEILSLPDMVSQKNLSGSFPSLPSDSLMKSFQQLPPLSSRSDSLSTQQQSNNGVDPLFTLTSSSSSSASSLGHFSSHSAAQTTSDHAACPSPISSLFGDPLFQSPASRSISKWADAQHLKCEQSLHYLKNIHSSLRIPHLETSTQATPSSIIKVSPLYPKPKRTLERLMSSPSSLFNRLPVLPPPRCSSFSPKK